ncbi:MAG TPA: CDP-alcohol phosphatidyltransferase family protein [Candidatus Saccharimonadales bacterium]
MEAELQKIREPIRGFIGRIAIWLDRASGGKLSPEAVTLFGFAMHVPIALLIAMRHNIWAVVLLVIFGLFDALDGTLARLQNRSGPRGMLLDSTTDRMKEILLYVGAAYAIIASTGRPYLAVWAVAACGCSLLTSYVNAWGDAVMSRFHVNKHTTNKSFRGGLFPFEVRMFVLVVGLLSNRLAVAVVIITFGAAYTALGRLLKIFKRLSKDNVQN